MGLPRVLVVDNFPDGREMLVEYLRFRGFDAHGAGDGAEAVARARVLLPDVILMDLAMPNVDGWEATRRIKADPRTRGVTIIAVTAHAFAPDEVSARQAGCDGYIAKPYDLTRLADALSRSRSNRSSLLFAADREVKKRPVSRRRGRAKARAANAPPHSAITRGREGRHRKS